MTKRFSLQEQSAQVNSTNVELGSGGRDGARLGSPGLLHLLFSHPNFWISVLLLGSFGALLGVLSPYFQREFIDSMWAGREQFGRTPETLWLMVWSFLSVVGAQFCTWALRVRCAKQAARVSLHVSHQVYDHALELHPRSRRRYAVGEMVALYAQDVVAFGGMLEEALPNALASLLPLIVAPLAIGLLFDVNLAACLGVAALGMGVCVLFAWRQAKLFSVYKSKSQARLAHVNEWLQNMKLLKISGRIEEFEVRIRAARESETRIRLEMVTNASLMNGVSQVLPQLINLAGLVVLIGARGDSLTPGEIFALLWVFGVFLNLPLRQFPWGLVLFVDAMSSYRRLREFLDSPKLARFPRCPEDTAQSAESSLAVETTGLEVRDLRVFGEGHELLLWVDRMSVREGEFVGVVGQVGSGKSLLLQALTGNFEPVIGSYTIGGRPLHKEEYERWASFFSFVPQGGFVMNASLRRNLAFDYDGDLPDDRELHHALELADFEPGQERLQDGLDAPLGERGANLSGGQKQRVSLARTLQFERDIVLLDDALSAVDIGTEKRLVQELLLGKWRHKTRIMATHRLSILPKMDSIIFLHRGRVLAQGSYTYLLETCSEFRDFVETQMPPGDAPAVLGEAQ